jgi:predicted trehalose synthase
VRSEDRSRLDPWARVWCPPVSVAFLKGYLETTEVARFLPRARHGRAALLEMFLLEKAACALRYELNNRPDWVRVPVEGLLELLDHNSREKP